MLILCVKFSATFSNLLFSATIKNIVLTRDPLHISLLILRELKWIKQFLFLPKLMKKLWFSDDFRGDKT